MSKRRCYRYRVPSNKEAVLSLLRKGYLIGDASELDKMKKGDWIIVSLGDTYSIFEIEEGIIFSMLHPKLLVDPTTDHSLCVSKAIRRKVRSVANGINRAVAV